MRGNIYILSFLVAAKKWTKKEILPFLYLNREDILSCSPFAWNLLPGFSCGFSFRIQPSRHLRQKRSTCLNCPHAPPPRPTTLCLPFLCNRQHTPGSYQMCVKVNQIQDEVWTSRISPWTDGLNEKSSFSEWLQKRHRLGDTVVLREGH